MRVWILMWYFLSAWVWGHSNSMSFLQLEVTEENVTLGWQVDLEDVMPELSPQSLMDTILTQQQVVDTANRSILLSSEQENCQWRAQDFQLNRQRTPVVLEVNLISQCQGQQLALDYSDIFSRNTTHQALLDLNQNGVTSTLVLLPEDSKAEIATSQMQIGVLYFIETGITHVLIGADHLLFLLILVLPLLTQRYTTKVLGQKLLTLVTCFTLAHSITLALLWFGWVPGNGPLIEVAIAVTIVGSGVRLLIKAKPMPLAWVFAFGLIHGLGFANSMRSFLDAGANTWELLLSFNLGVEIGQAAYVGFIILVLKLLSQKVLKPVTALASLAACGVGTFWAIDRASGLAMLGGII